jgi:two-component system cell cycle response regulator CpdR
MTNCGNLVNNSTPGGILVVEDDQTIGFLLQRILSQQGFDTAWVTQAADALQHVATQPHRFALLLTDLHLSDGWNGLDLATELRRLSPGLRVIYMSGEPLDAWPAGDTFLAKPFAVLDLPALITSTLAARDESQKSPCPDRPNPEAQRPLDSGV